MAVHVKGSDIGYEKGDEWNCCVSKKNGDDPFTVIVYWRRLEGGALQNMSVELSPSDVFKLIEDLKREVHAM